MASCLGGSACTENRVPAGIALRAIRECEDALVAASPHHIDLLLSDPTVRQGKGARYRLRAALKGPGSPGAVECHLDDTRGAMEVVGLSIMQS